MSSQKVLCIDPGHGYKGTHPTGAQANGIIEDDYALTLALKTKWYLTAFAQGRRLDVRAVITRPGKSFITLSTRPKIAKDNKCALFLSIHCNAAENREAHGAEALVVEGDTRSGTWAKKLLAVLVEHGMTSRGIKPDTSSHVGKLAVLRGTYRRMPAVLLELGFLSNPEDAARMKTIQFQEGAAAGIAKVLLDV